MSDISKLWVAPDAFFDLFKTDADAARKQTIEWLRKVAPLMSPGDRVVLPHGETGEPDTYIKGETIQ